ncbi:sunset domain-containing protein [Tessaracoccus sp.]
MKKSTELKKAAAHSAAAAAEAGQNALNDAVAKASELLADAQKAAGPMAHDAKVRTADFAAKRLDAWEPHIKDALDKVSPAVDAARDKVSDDILPKLQHLLHEAAENPVIVEAGRRSEAAVQALRGELEPKRKKGKASKFIKFVTISAIVAGAVAAVRHFLTPKDDGWTAHEPSKAYVNNNDTFATAAKVAGTNTEAAKSQSEDEAPKNAMQSPSDDPAGTQDDVTVETDVTEESAPQDADSAEAAHAGYGEGSYVGENPPEGFAIKGNERSKKYHLAGSGGYDRTIAEVWFNSEEAAEKAGFTRAQR